VSVKICIADGQARVRYGLRVLLEQHSGWIVTGEAADAHELLEVLECGFPDILLLDWQLAGIPPRELLTILNNAYPTLFVITLSGRSETRRAALAAGADAFVGKTESPRKLIAIIQEFQTDRIF
jgi:DNA-binding NarL/FixJ family response regulator